MGIWQAGQLLSQIKRWVKEEEKKKNLTQKTETETLTLGRVNSKLQPFKNS